MKAGRFRAPWCAVGSRVARGGSVTESTVCPGAFIIRSGWISTSRTISACLLNTIWVAVAMQGFRRTSDKKVKGDTARAQRRVDCLVPL
ncbi:hypothetical protein BD310DRAFT_941919 [Dichomitus squalens]|uniref:Uncharacterized protein n=1 Tax=Dichomitus squalens TaxID=114155 RepID=A0A4Q9PAA1_9APHY|nr:hypothetical protein BD310DRAFT_941919 [Dichomitus squalens]